MQFKTFGHERIHEVALTNDNGDGYPQSQAVLAWLQARNVPHGREQSFKLVPGRLLADRLLVGIATRALPATEMRALSSRFGMPQGGWEVLSAHLAKANAVFIGTEETPSARMLKMYVELWDEVRRVVREGAREPQLLHLGVKWSTARVGHWEEARYMCHPLLGVRDILRRMAGCYPDAGPRPPLESARSIVRHAAQREPHASFLYVEVQEAGNPRRSFDINLYKSGMLVRDAADEIRAIASHLGVPPADLEAQLEQLGDRALGHISGGMDRRGEEFLSVYAEVQPLPDVT